MSKFALGFIIVSLSAVAVGLGGVDATHHATYSMATDKVALIVGLPTRNEPGKPIMVLLELQNNNDHEVSYFASDPSFPFELEIRDDTGKLLSGGGGTDPKSHVLAAHTSIKKEVDLAIKVHDSGQYLLTIRRGINEFGDDWEELEVCNIPFYIGKVLGPYDASELRNGVLYRDPR